MQLSAWLATSPDSASIESLAEISTEQITFLENAIDRLQKGLPVLKGFILPGGHITAAWAHVARSGISGFTILHGVRLPDDLYYASLFQQSAENYIPCLSEAKKLPADSFQGNVTQYLEQHLESKAYDFYLCGGREMVRDVTLLIDERFLGSLVYTELFY